MNIKYNKKWVVVLITVAISMLCVVCFGANHNNSLPAPEQNPTYEEKTVSNQEENVDELGKKEETASEIEEEKVLENAEKTLGSNKEKVAKEDKEISEEELNDASKTIIDRSSKKEKRIAELTIKYNDEFNATVAYYLEIAQKYSWPICFIGLAMGAFNFLIVGNKKLDKKEQGFGWIVGFTIGLVVFNVIPLLFALFVAGR